MPETTKRQTRKDRKRADRAKRRLVQEEKLEKKLNEPIREASVSDSRRRRGIVFQVAFAAVIAVLVLAVAVSAIIKASHGTTYELAYMSTGELVKKGSAKAVFVRQGEILTAAGKGTFIPNVREGDRVNVGYVVGYITQDEYVADLKKLQSIDKVILSLQEKEALSDGFDIPELDNADRDIAEFKNQLTDMAVKGKLADCGDVILALNAALEYRNELIINAETGNSSVSQLQNQREALAAALEKNMTPVKAPQSGIVSFYIDGNEASENNAFLQLGVRMPGRHAVQF